MPYRVFSSENSIFELEYVDDILFVRNRDKRWEHVVYGDYLEYVIEENYECFNVISVDNKKK